MKRKPGIFNQLQAIGPRGELVSDGAIAFAVWLLAMVLSIVFALVILSSADPSVFPSIGFGLGVN
jgi:hypothetical protein